jgi:hypothetical protein
MPSLQSLKGVLVRNLVVHGTSGADTDGPARSGTAEQSGQPASAKNAPPHEGALRGTDGGCFFSLHPVESSSGQLIDACVYVSTLCKERCNPSWSDIEYDDLSAARKQGSRIGIRVWTATPRLASQLNPEPEAGHGQPSHRRNAPTPRMAPWEMGRMILDCAEEGGFQDDVEKGETVGIGAKVPAWARRGGPVAAGHGLGISGARHNFQHGGLLGGGWIDSYRRGTGESADQRGLDVALSFEKIIMWANWVVVERPLSQLRVPVPQNALFLTLADSTGWISTYVDENDHSLSKLIKPTPAMHTTAGTDSDSEAPTADAASVPDASAERGRDASSVAASDAAQKEREREERERRREAERERERQQRSLLLGHKDSRTPTARSSHRYAKGYRDRPPKSPISPLKEPV